MVVIFNKYFVALVLILGSSSLFCSEPDEMTEEKMISLALKEFLDKKEKAENIIKECEHEGRNIVLPPTLFEKINISSRELEIALYFLNREARNTCEGDYLARFYVAGSRYRTTAKHFKKEATEALPYTEDMLFGSSWRELRIKLDYKSINSESRRALEKISALKKPFNLHKTLEILDAP